LSNLARIQASPIAIRIAQKSYSEFVPTASVVVQTIKDDEVTCLDEALKTEVALCFNKMFVELEGEPDSDYVFTRLDGLLSKRIKWLRYWNLNGQYSVARLNDELLRICRQLRNHLNNYEFLFEDMFLGFEVEDKETCFYYFDSLENRIKPSFVTKARLIDYRDQLHETSRVDEYWPKLRSKAHILRGIISDRRSDKGVIFSRKIRLADEIAAILRELGISFVQIDSRISDEKRDAAIQQFQSEDSRILIITRNTGKRGLDLPQADYGIFYSPKAEENTVWQELSRIRSNIQHLKDSYFFFYSETTEENKMRDLVDQMRSSGREYCIHFT